MKILCICGLCQQPRDTRSIDSGTISLVRILRGKDVVL